MRYNGSLLSDTDAANVAQALQQALASILSDGYDTVLVGDISLLGDEGRAQVQQWNSHKPDLWPVTIDQIVYQRVLEQPNAPAIQAPDGEYTYGQLNSAADRFSRYLLTLGVEPETIVPFCFTKSAWAIISVLAILKAGATAAALDPSYPPERLQQILSQTGASLIVSSKSVREKIEQTASSRRVVAVDEWFQANLEHPGLEDAPTGRSSADPSKAAFVVFTSGSTGNSKGIVLSHQSMCTSAFAHGAFMGLNPKSRVLQFAAYTFDVSNQDIWTTLMHGGCVCVPSDDERLNDIAGAINRMAVNWTFLTPTVARLLTPALVPTLRTLVLGGEAITQSNVDTWASDVRLLNSYGPAECSICCAVSELSDGSRLTEQQKQQIDPANIGWALPSAILWIANPQNHNVLSPIGAVGELLIEGPILAREYLHDPERTAAAFIESPTWASGSVPQRRFYKTGDLVRYASDGTMRFVGRKDHQVKIRGQRTELGDIEHHLITAPTVKQGSVFLPKKGHWADRLVAVVSLAELSGLPTRNGELHLAGSEHGKTVTEAVKTLHGLLSERLPSYMIPAAWFVVESIPLTPSAKVDRKKILHWIEGMDRDIRNDGDHSLPVPTTNGRPHVNGKNGEKPSEREGVLQQIWGHVLNIPVNQVDLDRSFISAGGDSISAMQVMGEARVQNLALSVQEILSAGSIIELAANARYVRPVDTDIPSSMASFSAFSEEAEVPFELTPMQMQHFRLAPDGDSSFSQGFLFSLPHKVSVETFTDAIEALVSRHDMLRARFTQDATGAWKQHIASIEDDDSFELRSHRVKSLDKIDAALQRARAGLDFANGPVFSVDLFDVRGQGQQQLVYILAHQLVVDLVSWRVLLQELEEFLRRGEIGHPQPFPFSQWCRLQYEKAQTLDPSKTLPWALESPDISFWGLHPIGHSYGSVVEEKIRLESDVSGLLLGQVPESLGVEPIDIFMASIAVSLAEVFPDHFVPTLFQEGHGRQPWDDAIDLSRTVGWFTTMAPIPFQPDDGSLGAETLAQKIHQSRKEIPDKGWADYTARFLAPSNAVAEPAAHELLEMVFNYEGIYQLLEREDSWIQHGPAFPSDTSSKRDPARAFGLASTKAKFRSDFVSLLAVFEITAAVVSSQIEFSFLYPPSIQHRNRVSRWVERVQETLNAVARSAAGGSGDLAVQAVKPLAAPNYPFSHHAAGQAESLPDALAQSGIYDASLVEDVYRSSPMQEGLLLSQSSSNNRGGTYVLNYIWEFIPHSGSSVRIDIERLSRAWKSVVQRHPALRTAFISAPNGHIDQIVFRQREVHMEHETIRDIQDQDLLSAASSLEDLDPLRPQHQLTLVETANGEQQFLKLAIHHTIFDGESAPVLASEIAAAYDEQLELRQPEPIPYLSLIKYLAERDGVSALAYWKDQLSGAVPCHFPALTEGAAGKDAKVGAVTDRSDRYELHAIKLDQSPAALQKACSRAGITLSTLFLTTWALVLRAYTGQQSVSFGFLASGRDAPIPGIESVIGPVLNMLISHAVIKASSTPQEIAIGIQKNFVQSLSHQFTPLAEIHRELGQTKKSLFNTVLSYQRTLSQRKDPSQGTFHLERIGGQSKTEYGITLNVNVSDEDIRVVFKYWTSALSQAFAIRVADTFRTVLSSVVQEFETPLERIDLLSPSDSRDISAWGDGGRVEATKCIHTLVKQRAIESPDAVAIRSWDATLTYAELDAAASGLSYNLREKGSGIGPDVRVPILAPRSARAIVGLLAVLKAGWAGFVVDPSASDEELGENLSYADPHIILTTNELIDKAEKLGSFSHVITLDAASSIHQSDEPQGHLDVATLDNLCSIVFTSGLTEGRPRAVFLSHRSVASRAVASKDGLGLTPSSSVLHHSPSTGHEGLLEVWATLTSGSTLCIPEPSTDALVSLSKTINELNVNWAILTPTVAGILDPGSVPSLQTLVLAGEPSSIRFYEEWREERQLIQAFSTAEVGTVSSTADVSDVKDPSQIGRPLKNTRVWVADPHNHELPVPIGVVGELLVEGTVSGLTEASPRWVERPAWSTRLLHSNDHVHYRLYKTGDLVRYLPDGTLKYMSRVKESGLGALERQLLSQTHMRQVVLVNVSEGLLKQQLVAVYTSFTTADGRPDSHPRDIVLSRQPDADSSPLNLRQLLESYGSDGPEPKLFIPIEAFPRLPTGKIDRRRVQQRLESLDADQYREILQLNQTGERSVTALSDPTEDALAEIWSEVLHVPKQTIGRETPFYNLGGDSISAIQAAARGRRLDLNLTVQDILQHRTIARIAPVVARRQPAVDAKTIEYKETTNVPFGLAPIQALFFDADLDGKQRYYQSQYLELKKPVSRQDVSAALAAIVRRHPMLRARFTRDEDDEWTQSVSDDVDGSFMLGVVRDAQLDDITGSIKAAVNTIDIEAGPLVASRLFQYSTGRDILFIAVHHLVVDHVSWRIILKELEGHLLERSLDNEPAPYPFQRWSQSLADYSSQHLRQPDEILPYDVPAADTIFWGLTGQGNTHGQVEQLTVLLNEDLTSRLLTQSQARLLTEPVDVMLGALLHAFVEVFPDRGIPAIFNEGHGRDALSESCDISQTVGWFSTVAPLLSSTGESALDTIRRVKDVRQSLRDGGWPYFASRYLTPEGQAQFGHHYPMEVVFNYLGRYQGLEQDDTLFRRLPKPDVGCLYRNLARFSLFEVLVSVNAGQLEIQLSYPKATRHQGRLEGWMKQYLSTLEEAVISEEGALLSLADFPLLEATYPDLDRVVNEVIPTIAGPITINDIEDLYPSSPIQAGLLLSQARNTAYYEYFTVAEVVLPGGGLVDTERLAQAWRDVVQRHSILRTVFVDSIFPQSIYDQAVVRGLPVDIVQVQAGDEDPSAILRSLPGLEFRPGQALHRLSICTTNAGAAFIRLDTNHAISDGTSTGILLRDLSAVYHGRQVPPPPVSQYRDFVSFLLQNPREKQVGYWVDRLSGIEPCLLPTSAQQPVVPATELHFTQVKLPKHIARIRTFCIQNGVTVSTLLQTAWAMVLRVYTNAEQVCFGYLVSGRDAPIDGIEDIVGPFLNLLVCKVPFDQASSPRNILQDLQAQFVAGLPHQFCPLADILHALELGGQTLFNTAFSFQRTSQSSTAELDERIQFRRQRARDPTEVSTRYRLLLSFSLLTIHLAV